MTALHRLPHTTRRRGLRRAFTLVEVIIIVTIIAILAGAVTLRLTGVLGGAKTKVAQSEARALASALKLYTADTGTTPYDGMDLGVLLLPPGDGGGPNGPYLERADAINDPWGRQYMVRVPGVVNFDFDILSYGRDGQPGGTGEDEDITQ